MILAIYKRNRPKDKWQLYSFAESAESARLQAEALTELSKNNDKAEIIIQSFDNALHIPEFLINVKPEKLIYN